MNPTAEENLRRYMPELFAPKNIASAMKKGEPHVEINLDYIIKEKPPTNVVRDYFRTKIDEIPDDCSFEGF